jgi:hypothetical protein
MFPNGGTLEFWRKKPLILLVNFPWNNAFNAIKKSNRDKKKNVQKLNSLKPKPNKI